MIVSPAQNLQYILILAQEIVYQPAHQNGSATIISINVDSVIVHVINAQIFGRHHVPLVQVTYTLYRPHLNVCQHVKPSD
jgi:hypothetical protein